MPSEPVQRENNRPYLCKASTRAWLTPFSCRGSWPKRREAWPSLSPRDAPRGSRTVHLMITNKRSTDSSDSWFHSVIACVIRTVTDLYIVFQACNITQGIQIAGNTILNGSWMLRKYRTGDPNCSAHIAKKYSVLRINMCVHLNIYHDHKILAQGKFPFQSTPFAQLPLLTCLDVHKTHSYTFKVLILRASNFSTN